LGEQRAGKSAQATADQTSDMTVLARATTSVSTPSTLTAATLLPLLPGMRIKFGSCNGISRLFQNYAQSIAEVWRGMP
jgi:uncharacterized membrane protein YjjP (DUF1212 family)